MADLLLFLFVMIVTGLAWLLDRRARAAAAARRGEEVQPPAVPPVPGQQPEPEVRVAPVPLIPLRVPLVIPPTDTSVRRGEARAGRPPAGPRPARLRFERRRARPITVARARDGMVLSVILGPCRGIGPQPDRG